MEPQKRLFWRFVVLSIALSMLFTASAVIGYQFRLIQKADLTLYDLHFRWRGAQSTSGNVVLVLMDQKSAQRLHRKQGVWSRFQMADALNNLCNAGADVIGLDMVFFAPSHLKEEDRALAEAIEDCGNVVLAKFVAVEGRGEVIPLPLFQEAMIGDGFINMFTDIDGVLRKSPFFSVKPVPGGLDISPSFSLEVVRLFLNLEFVLDFSRESHVSLGAKDAPQLLLPHPDLRIHFYGGDEVFHRLSYADVVSNRFSPERVKGKIILIGSSLATDKDFFTTPFSASTRAKRAKIYGDKFREVLGEDLSAKDLGVACHAHAIETILNGHFIRKCGEKGTIAMIVLFGFIGLLFYSQRPGALWGIVILTGLSLGLLGVSHRLFVDRLTWLEIAPAIFVMAVQYTSGIACQWAYSRQKSRMVTDLFGKYVSEGVVKDILKGDIGVRLEGRSKEITVFFSDLRGFTTISEGLTAQETGRLLNTFFDAMIPVIFEHQGTLDKLMGDAIMAFFGAPGELKDHPQRAAEAALRMMKRLEALKRESRERGIKGLDLGIGLNTGTVTVGNLGSPSFMDYTVVGDTVNLGSRLEGLNKTYGTHIIMGESTATKLDERFVHRELDLVRVKGKEDAVKIFELVGFRNEAGHDMMDIIRRFKKGLHQYRSREWEGAEETFSRLLKEWPDDGPSRLYLERTRELTLNPPPPQWEPVYTFTTK